MSAQGSRTRNTFMEEVTWGITPASPDFTALPSTSFSINLGKDIYNDDTIRSDRRRQFNVHGNRTVTGDIAVNFAAASFDPLIASALNSDWSSDVIEDGVTEKSFTVEKGALDINQYLLYTGIKVNQWSLSVPTSGLVTSTFSVMGKDMSISGSTIDGSVVETSIARPFFHAGGSFLVGGQTVGNISALELSVDNEGETNYALGVATARDITNGFTTVNGTVTVYFEDASYYNAFINETTSSLTFTLSDGANSYTFVLGKIKYDGAESTIAGQGSVLLTIPFTALSDNGAAIVQVTRSLA